VLAPTPQAAGLPPIDSVDVWPMLSGQAVRSRVGAMVRFSTRLRVSIGAGVG